MPNFQHILLHFIALVGISVKTQIWSCILSPALDEAELGRGNLKNLQFCRLYEFSYSVTPIATNILQALVDVLNGLICKCLLS